ncbi:MAG: radical SAM protein [Candidatus Methylomirabilis sp.]|nr:radical SAM protein [Deltaproteobacteria bacterium]
MLLAEGLKYAGMLVNEGPSYIVLFVTARCNLLCDHCFYTDEIQAADRAKELSLDEYEKVSAKAGRIWFMNLTGGEPFIRDDLPEIATLFARNNGCTMFTIPSNGFMTERTVELCRRMFKANPKVNFRIGVSLDDIGDAHDRIRNMPGAFKNAIATIEALKGLRRDFSNFAIESPTCLNASNKDHIEEIQRYKEGLGLDASSVNLIRGDPKVPALKDVSAAEFKDYVDRNPYKIGRLSNAPLFSAMRNVTYERIHRALLDPEKRSFKCFAMNKMVVIAENGDVRDCELLHGVAGNLRDHGYDLRAALATDEGKRLRKDIEDEKCACTWECGIQNGVVFNPREYPAIVKELVKFYAA